MLSFKNMYSSGLGGLDSYRSQQTRQVLLGLLLLIFAKLIAQPPLFLNSFILDPTSLGVQGMNEEGRAVSIPDPKYTQKQTLY